MVAAHVPSLREKRTQAAVDKALAGSSRRAKDDLSELFRSLGHALRRDFETFRAWRCFVATGVAEHTFDSCRCVDHKQICRLRGDAVYVRNVFGQEDDAALRKLH